MGNVKVDFGGITGLFRSMKELKTDEMCEDVLKQLGTVYIATAKKNTPVGGNKQAEVSKKHSMQEVQL